MLEYEVTNRDELAAAVLAAAQQSFKAAAENPVTITLLGTRCRYVFKNGIQYGRADRLAREISRTPKGAFK